MTEPVASDPSGSPVIETFDDLLRAERACMANRPDAPRKGGGTRVGLALSGGGIRSATFSIGFLQALSRQRLLGSVDYLSTVSGGSYAGAFLCSLFVAPQDRGAEHVADRPVFDAERPLQSPLGVEAVRRLRDMGRYLTPSGTSDAVYAGAIVLRNWFAIQFALGMLALLIFCLVIATDSFLPQFKAWLPLHVSPTIASVAIAFVLLAVSAGIAYWLTRRDTIPQNLILRIGTNPFLWALLALTGYCAAALTGHAPALTKAAAGAGLGATALACGGAVLLHGYAEFRFGAAPKGAEYQALVAAEDRVRTALSKTMAWSMTVAGMAIGLGLADWLGSSAVEATSMLVDQKPDSWWDMLRHAWPTLVAVVPPVMSFIASRQLKSRVPPTDPSDGSTRRDWMPTLLVGAGVLMIVAWLILWSAAAHAAHHALTDTARPWVLLALVVENVGQAFCYSFLNLSSLSTFYAARLRRAYIGASSYGTPFTSVRADDPEDAMAVDAYYTSAIGRGAPLHIVNVTIAETMPAGSNLVARDRKGKTLQLSPAGLAFEGAAPGTMRATGRPGGENLPLANWVAISGAAVSAAIGSGTSLGTSILATLSNVRLGYWWQASALRASAAGTARTGSGIMDRIAAAVRDTVQGYLIQELHGAFSGDRRNRWYLTDGGHFENTGVYALLQREVPFIVACDNGADPRYRMEDVIRLLGRSRSDLGCEIDFLGADALAERIGAGSPLLQWIGPFDKLAKPGSPTVPGGPIAAMADIRYREGATGKRATGTLLLVKPRLTWREPPEVIGYRNRPGCADFPQQTTGDQFFDEEQWEAYRRLGELAGERLFPARRPENTLWTPRDGFAAPAERAARVAGDVPMPPAAAPRVLPGRVGRPAGWLRGFRGVVHAAIGACLPPVTTPGPADTTDNTGMGR